MSPRSQHRSVINVAGFLMGGLRGFVAKLKKSSRRASTGGDAPNDQGSFLDMLIDGKNITVTDLKDEDIGYVMGWTSRKIPKEFRPVLWTHVGRLELEAWTAILRDKNRALPGDLTMIFWEGLPLAVWIPAGLVTGSNFNPN
ncbi:MAG TPA: hypothetical protein VND96_13275 [Candidatus Micrarchaeaceae archaeon]|nr:hypothetical protein [Candidatus Micrarchaeaceae archaeon]